MSSEVNKALETVLRQHETTLNKASLAEWLGGDSIELLVYETKIGKTRVIGVVHDQLLQLSRQTVKGGWRALVGVDAISTGDAGVHVVVCQDGCILDVLVLDVLVLDVLVPDVLVLDVLVLDVLVLDVLARRHHLEVCGCRKLGQTHVCKFVRGRCAYNDCARLQLVMDCGIRWFSFEMRC